MEKLQKSWRKFWVADPFRRTKYDLWLRVFLWCGVIFLFSSIPNYTGTEPNFETAWGILKFLSRKAAHLSEYAVLMLLTFRAAEKTAENLKRWSFLFSFGFSILFALSDEWHQSFVFGRSGTALDVFIDSIGALLGYLYCVTRS